jgi:hypothetical protein
LDVSRGNTAARAARSALRIAAARRRLAGA